MSYSYFSRRLRTPTMTSNSYPSWILCQMEANHWKTQILKCARCLFGCTPSRFLCNACNLQFAMKYQRIWPQHWNNCQIWNAGWTPVFLTQVLASSIKTNQMHSKSSKETCAGLFFLKRLGLQLQICYSLIFRAVQEWRFVQVCSRDQRASFEWTRGHRHGETQFEFGATFITFNSSPHPFH